MTGKVLRRYESDFKTYAGPIFNAENDTIFGYGTAAIHLDGKQAIIYVAVTITTGGTNNIFAYGVNRDFFTSLVNHTITPQVGGVLFFTNSTSFNFDLTGYGGHWGANSQFWTPGRLYDQNGNTGQWPAANLQAGAHLFGVCYGTY